ncbi:MAG: sugar ABC transporter permease [Spirochaeta sp.]|jgi:raffinose/stachyose/melibiose transport system permease protein|nr:sugar ABC transporter permease [Spirochaeta sp.]
MIGMEGRLRPVNRRFNHWKAPGQILGFVAPALAFYVVFVLVPAFGGMWYSLTNWNILNPSPRFVGLDNYVEALTQDPYFLDSVLFTLKYVGFMVVFQNVLALFLAVLVEGRTRGRVAFRMILFMPNMISMIIGGFMWLFIYTQVLPDLADFSAFSFLDQQWIGDPAWSFYSILIVSLWAGVGYLMVIYIAALQGVPVQLVEAAEVDGASRFRAFRSVVLPMILPSVTIGVFLSLNMSFKVFEVVYALTGGGPGRATQVIALNIFEEAFNMSNRYGYASAKATLLFALVFAITLIQLRIMKSREVQL